MGRFDGYYFEHCQDERTLSLIAGCTDDRSFVQVLCDTGSYRYAFPAPPHSDPLMPGGCRFGRAGSITAEGTPYRFDRRGERVSLEQYHRWTDKKRAAA